MFQELTFGPTDEIYMSKPSLQVEETDGTWWPLMVEL